MEVEVVGIDGVSQDAIISIRAGASRRQASVAALKSSSSGFRFAGGSAGINPFKVDILQPIGSTRLALKPGGGKLAVPIDGTNGVVVNLSIREPNAANRNGQNAAEDLFDRLDANKDGVISRGEFADILKSGEGGKPILQPKDGGNPIPVSPSGVPELPPLPKLEDGRFTAAATAAKQYLEDHKLLPFVRALLQTVVRDRPEDPFIFIAEQFRSASIQKPHAPESPQKPQAPKTAEQEAQLKSAAPPVAAPAEEQKISAAEVPVLRPESCRSFKHLPSTGSWLAGRPRLSQVQPFAAPSESAKQSVAADGALDGALLPPVPERSSSFSPEEEEAQQKSLPSVLPATEEKSVPTSALPEAPVFRSFQHMPSTGTWLVGRPLKVQGAALCEPVSKSAAAREFSEGAAMATNQDAARDAVHNALLIHAAAMGLDLSSLSPEELEDAKAKAQAALASVLAAATGASSPPSLNASKADAREALEATEATLFSASAAPSLSASKANAREALEAALFSDSAAPSLSSSKANAREASEAALFSGPFSELEMAEAKSKAKDAFVQSLAADGNDEQALKAQAQEALMAALMGNGDDYNELDEAKQKARDALSAALLDDIGDVETAKAKAREAMCAALLGGAKASDVDSELADAKSMAREALGNVLLSGGVDADVEGAKAQARDALSRALGGGDEDVEDAKATARDALSRALGGDDEDVEDAKARAREALSAALMGNDNVDTAKAKARDALSVSFLGDSELDDAKARAREALQVALYGDDGDMDTAKASARDALAAALSEDGDDFHVEAAKIEAREALAAALMGRPTCDTDDLASGTGSKQPALTPCNTAVGFESAIRQPAITPCNTAVDLDARSARNDVREATDPASKDGELDAKMAELMAAREEMSKMNQTLKEEVSELNRTIEDMKKDRDDLRSLLSPKA